VSKQDSKQRSVSTGICSFADAVGRARDGRSINRVKGSHLSGLRADLGRDSDAGHRALTVRLHGSRRAMAVFYVSPVALRCGKRRWKLVIFRPMYAACEGAAHRRMI
jgi:hypothetical protein